jgi:hypothetical protein
MLHRHSVELIVPRPHGPKRLLSMLAVNLVDARGRHTRIIELLVGLVVCRHSVSIGATYVWERVYGPPSGFPTDGIVSWL